MLFLSGIVLTTVYSGLAFSLGILRGEIRFQEEAGDWDRFLRKLADNLEEAQYVETNSRENSLRFILAFDGRKGDTISGRQYLYTWEESRWTEIVERVEWPSWRDFFNRRWEKLQPRVTSRKEYDFSGIRGVRFYAEETSRLKSARHSPRLRDRVVRPRYLVLTFFRLGAKGSKSQNGQGEAGEPGGEREASRHTRYFLLSQFEG